MAGYFQKTTTSGQGVPRLKYSADYATLQAAINDLTIGDTLFVNADYTLTATVEVSQRAIQIIGSGLIKPTGNGSPSPLIRIKNTSSVPSVNNVTIRGLRFENAAGVANGAGVGYALEVRDDLPVGPGGVWHIICDAIDVNNFGQGVRITNAFDVVVSNCHITNSQIGLRCETTTAGKGTGQVKLFGGMFLNNEYHCSVDSNAQNLTMDHVELFGVSMGHQRPLITDRGSTGVWVGKDCGGVFIYGSHLEDLATTVYGYSGFTTNVAIFGTRILPSTQWANTGVDYSTAGASIGSLALIGVGFIAPATIPLYKVPSALHGVLVGGNTRSAWVSAPSDGLIEAIPVDGKSLYRIAVYSNSTRPTASTVPAGSSMYNTDTKKLNISDGAVWRDANGAPA